MEGSRRNEREISRESHEEVDLRSKIGGRKECYCGVRAPMWTSWSDDNQGRRFVGCPYYEDPTKSCKYFEWIDPDSSEMYKKIIVSLRSEMKLVKKDNQAMQDREEKIMKKNAKLRDKLSEVELNIAMATDLERKGKEKEKKLKMELRKRIAKESRLWLAILASWIITFGVVIGSVNLKSSSTAKFLP